MAYVVKADGEEEKFDKEKLKQSILDAGASPALADEVMRNFMQDKAKGQKKNISSQEIVDIIIRYLKKDKGSAARYDLRRAIMELGPAGYSFEAYFARILQDNGFTVKVNEHFKGKNIMHEVDIDAKRNHRYMVECKYHNKRGIKTRVKDPLYVYARFLDLEKHFDSPWLATNTKCTDDALNYARGVGMRITAWDYPKEFSLKELICCKHLYPITVIRGISFNSKETLFKCGIYLIQDLANIAVDKLVFKTGFSETFAKRIVNEAKGILGEP